MKIAHVGDAHFGFRAYHHRTETGVNVRENDVALAFREAAGQIIEYRPDVLILTGDIFDGPNPTPAVMLEAIRQLRAIQEDTDCITVLLGGNHDSPSVAGDGNPIQVLADAMQKSLTVLIIDGPEVHNILRLRNNPDGGPPLELKLSIVGLPHGTYGADRMLERADAAKASGSKFSILAVHAPIEVHGEDRLIYARMSDESIPVEVLRPERWTYLAAGDFHEFLKLGPNACYAGSIENVNAGPWGNTLHEKGWVSYDTETKVLDFNPLKIRPVLECPPIDCHNLTPANIMMAMYLFREQVGDFDGKIVRYQLLGATAETLKLLDWQDIREWKAEAMHLVIKPVPSKREEAVIQEFSSALHAQSLRKEMENFIDEQFTPGVGIQKEHIQVYAAECLDA